MLLFSDLIIMHRFLKTRMLVDKRRFNSKFPARSLTASYTANCNQLSWKPTSTPLHLPTSPPPTSTPPATSTPNLSIWWISFSFVYSIVEYTVSEKSQVLFNNFCKERPSFIKIPDSSCGFAWNNGTSTIHGLNIFDYFSKIPSMGRGICLKFSSYSLMGSVSFLRRL